MTSYYETQWPYFEYLVRRNSFIHALSVACLHILIVRYAKNIVPLIASFVFAACLFVGTLLYYDYFKAAPSLHQVTHIPNLVKISDQIKFQLVQGTHLSILVLLVFALSLDLRSLALRKRLRMKTSERKVDFSIMLICWVCFVSSVIWGVLNHYGLGPMVHINRGDFSYRDSVGQLKQDGFMIYYAHEALYTAFRQRKTVPWPGKINPAPLSALPINYSGKNIILLQVESLDAEAVHLRIGDQWLMPNLRKMYLEATSFPLFFSHHRGGTSADAELSTLLSLLPLQTHLGLHTVNHSKILPLPEVMQKNGYHTVAMHANTGAFFNRKDNFPKIGFEAFLDADDFSGEASGWKSKDILFYEQVLEKTRNLREPFFLYVITMQSHGPFKNHSLTPDTFPLQQEKEIVRDYFLCMREIDQAIGYFFSELKKSALHERSIIMLFADHSSMVNYSHLINDELFPTLHEEQIPFLIIGTGLPPKVHHDRVASHIDIAPTILHLTGIREPDNWLGTSVLTEGERRVLLNYSPPVIISVLGAEVVVEGKNERYLKFIKYSESLLR